MSDSLISTNDKPVTFLAVSDRTQAKAFYCDKLGLKVQYEDDYALVLDIGVTTLRISELKDFKPQKFTVLGWEVADIAACATKLKNENIKTKKYDGMEQDELGIWRSPSTSIRILWFEDPDGNLLSLSDPTS